MNSILLMLKIRNGGIVIGGKFYLVIIHVQVYFENGLFLYFHSYDLELNFINTKRDDMVYFTNYQYD